MSDGPAPGGWHLPRRFHFVRHCGVFATVTALALGIRLLTGSDWPLFWPIAIWASALALHYFLASSYDVDSDWIEDRITDLKTRSYDFDHIQNIEQRIQEGDTSVTPPTERRRDSAAR